MSKSTSSDIVEQLRIETQKELPDVKRVMQLSSELSKLDSKFQRFSIDAKTLIHLGRDSIKDHTTALIELVKNSYDADSFDVEVDVLCQGDNHVIRVADNGFGMTREQLISNWLRIGFSEKRKSKESEFGRRKTGEKGIGRISTDRLGACLELITKTQADGLIGVKINWNDFDVEGMDIFDIQVELTDPSSINIPVRNGVESASGTEILITNLRQVWTRANIENLYYDLSALTSPFEEVTDFEIRLKNDIAPEYSATVISPFYKNAQIEVTVLYDGSEEVYYSIKEKDKTEVVDTISLQQFYAKGGGTTPVKLESGPVEIRLLFFLRQSSSVLGTGFKLDDLRQFLDNNNGVKVYRDNVAVKPYGFQKSQLGYDWLGLGDRKTKNPAGLGRGSEYTVSPNQLVGGVFIKRDVNLELLDSAAREGFIESEGFIDMKDLVMASVRLLETYRAENYGKGEQPIKPKDPTAGNAEADSIKNQLDSVKTDLQDIRDELQNTSQPVRPQAFLKPIARTIEKVESISENVEVTLTDLINWQRVLNGLATIGISSAVFGHETEGSITQFQGSSNTAIKLLKASPPRSESALIEIEKAFKHSKQVAAWGAYALTRVQKEKRSRRNTPILKILENVVKELKPAFTAASIDITIKGDNFFSVTYPMDIESILVNLLTNAYTACLLKANKRMVVVDVKREDLDGVIGYYFAVRDSGPGIAKEFERRIFDPLFSTKTTGTSESNSVGTGLGLTIVKSIVNDLKGQIFVSRDKELNGANFKIWMPK